MILLMLLVGCCLVISGLTLVALSGRKDSTTDEIAQFTFITAFCAVALFFMLKFS